jgi:DNA mismatch repair ATPase MutS
VIVLQLIWVAVNYRRFKSAFESIEGLHPELYSYKSLFEWIENCDIKSACLKQIRDDLSDKDNIRGGTASKQLRRLHIICLFIQARSQPLLFLILNSLFLYDLYCFYFLEKWVNESGKMLPENLEKLGDWEALMSLSMTKMIYPECSFPTFITESEGRKAYFNAKKMGHPLIPVNRQVRNDISLPEGIALITGSNMSGKTTLLRTVGINTVMAYSGGVCCVDYFELGLMRIGSSMRIADSLEEGLSTFYAELLRIEKIINMSKTQEPLLFLIDEIFRGTNSRDRTEGAQLVLKHLSRDWVIGLMSTHDYQLCETNKDNSGKVLFYYFSERYDEEGIHFDYLLSHGVSTSANAKYLMKMVGIE